jgi:hypothetical protein
MHRGTERAVAWTAIITCALALASPARAQGGEQSGEEPSEASQEAPAPPPGTKRAARAEVASGVVLLAGSGAAAFGGVMVAIYPCWGEGACPAVVATFAGAGAVFGGGLSLIIHGARALRAHTRFTEAPRQARLIFEPFVLPERRGLRIGLTTGARF